MAAAVTAWGTIGKHFTKPLSQVAAPDCKRSVTKCTPWKIYSSQKHILRLERRTNEILYSPDWQFCSKSQSSSRRMLRNKLRVMGFQAGVGMDTEFGRVKRPKKKRECESSSDESNDCRVDVAQKKLSSSQAQLGQATYLAVA